MIIVSMYLSLLMIVGIVGRIKGDHQIGWKFFQVKLTSNQEPDWNLSGDVEKLTIESRRTIWATSFDSIQDG